MKLIHTQKLKGRLNNELKNIYLDDNLTTPDKVKYDIYYSVYI